MTDRTLPVIGFIGLGLMGSAMAQRLLSLNYPLNVIANRNREAIEQAVAKGAIEYSSIAELTKNSDVVMLCLSTSNVVEAVMEGPDGVIENLKKDSLVIDFGTSLPASTKKLAMACNNRGASMMDAPLGRTPAQAIDGLLNIMAAGSEQDFKRIEPVLNDLGENVYHVGVIGAGHTLKLINNFFGMTTACAMSEAFAMADVAGLKREALYDVMSSGPLRSVMMDLVKANAVDGNSQALAFSIANAHKDLRYYGAMADEFDVNSFIAPAVKNTFGLAKASNWGNRMVSEMVDYIANIYDGRAK